MSSRRSFVGMATGVASAGMFSRSFAAVLSTAVADTAGASDDELARDEAHWNLVAQAYDLDGHHIVLNGGGNNPLPRVVIDALTRYDRMVASQPRPHNVALVGRMDVIRARLAQLLGCDADEVAITRNTTEGLNTVASGLALATGDEILLSQHDRYYAGAAFASRVERDGVKLAEVVLPLDATPSAIVRAFATAMTPRTRLIVASHLVDGWGFVLPIRELSALAHRHGAALLADGALSFGQIPVDVRALGCDFYATSLHKWLSAPLGTGLLYVRRDRVPSLWPLYGSAMEPADIRKFEAIGTRSGPTVAAIGQALDFLELIGLGRKHARVRYLLEIALAALAGVARVQTFTEYDRTRRAGLARISIQDVTGPDFMLALRAHGIYTYGNFPGEHDGVYISPNLFNTAEQMRRFAEIVKVLARDGVPRSTADR